MPNFYKVSLHPNKVHYLPLNDLEKILNRLNFIELLPHDSGARKNFLGLMKRYKQHGITFTLEKESRWDVMWSVHDGRKNLGTYMVCYGQRSREDPRPVWHNSKSYKVEKGRSAADRVTFSTICMNLDAELKSPTVNSWTYHRIVKSWLSSKAHHTTPRPSGNGKQKTLCSTYYFLPLKYKQELDAIVHTYDLFSMGVTIEEVDA